MNGKRRGLRYLRLTGCTIAAGLLLYTVRLLLIFPWTPPDLVRRDALEPADLIVVLEGEYGSRLRHAFSLVERGYADRIYSPGYDSNEEKERLVQSLLEQCSVPVRMYFDTEAPSTYEEALRTREFAKQHRIESILLVTSNYHSYRSRWVFSKVLGDVEIVSATMPPDDNWFSLEGVEPGTFAFRIYRKEQLKFAAYYLAFGWRLYL